MKFLVAQLLDNHKPEQNFYQTSYNHFYWSIIFHNKSFESPWGLFCNLEDRRELLLQMRNRLQTQTGREKYLLGYRHFFLRSLKKVKGEFRLMCIGWNLKKMHKMMAFIKVCQRTVVPCHTFLTIILVLQY